MAERSPNGGGGISPIFRSNLVVPSWNWDRMGAVLRLGLRAAWRSRRWFKSISRRIDPGVFEGVVLMNCRTMSRLLGCVAVVAMSAGVAAAAPITLAQWTFETSVPTTAGPHAAEVGTGSATGVHASGATVYSNPAGNGSPESFSSNTWGIGDYYQFQTSTTGEGGVRLSWGQTRSSTGPSDFDLRWSTDNSTYTTFMSYVVPVITWSSGTFNPSSVFTADLTSIPALNDQPNVYFRLVATSAAGGTAGSNRVDDFTIAVPEPASVALMMLTGLALVGIRRRSVR
jgi:hypothetical protein